MLDDLHLMLCCSLLPLLFQSTSFALVYLADEGPERSIKLVLILDVLPDTQAFLECLVQLLVLLPPVSLHGVMGVKQG